MTKEAASMPRDQRVADVTASGHFRLDTWTKGSKLVLKPRPEYKSPPGTPSNLAGSRTVYVDSVEIPIIPDHNSRLAALQSGTIDIMTQPLSDYHDQLKSNPQVQTRVNRRGSYSAQAGQPRPMVQAPLLQVPTLPTMASGALLRAPARLGHAQRSPRQAAKRSRDRGPAGSRSHQRAAGASESGPRSDDRLLRSRL